VFDCTSDWSVARAVNRDMPAMVGMPQISPEPLRRELESGGQLAGDDAVLDREVRA
jgi:hypothetical protein